ncbi:MAG: hypothetical protein HY231_20690 [Acidobacteria bacterium]|nr:hypothetical protein [Acidobacteriota bacterium]
MKWLFSFVICSLLIVNGSQFQLATGANSTLVSTVSAQASDHAPRIIYAEWVGKNLYVQGDNFAAGATVFIDGQKLKTSNAAYSSKILLVAKKAKKKVAPDQAIKLQVQNPDGEESNEFTFYSGFVVTTSYQNSVIKVKVGERFLLFLPDESAAFRWYVEVTGADPTILSHSTDNLPISNSQGFYQAIKPGRVFINAQGSPLCPPAPPYACLSGEFHGFGGLAIDIDEAVLQAN